MQYQGLLARLPQGDPAEPVEEDVSYDDDDRILNEPRYCVCDFTEGNVPSVKRFRDAEAMARFFGIEDGKESSLWFFYGVPMRFTQKDKSSERRFLVLPGEREAVLIPKSDREPIEVVPRSLLGDIEWQDDGWVGAPELASNEEYYSLQAQLEPGVPAEPDEDEPDEEDEFDDQPVD